MRDVPLLPSSKRLTAHEMKELVRFHNTQSKQSTEQLTRKLRSAAQASRPEETVRNRIRDVGLDPDSSDITKHPDGSFALSVWAPDGITVIRV